jgi:NAD-dependent dihydropyrimidine dehydrogenase PreA subunit
VDDRVDTAHRVAERRRIGQIAERDLHVHALRSQTSRVAHKAANRHGVLGQAAQQSPADKPAGTGQQDHPPSIGTKDNSCVEVCPVDCIHPTPDEASYDEVEMLYIDPEECIDCDACVEACPVDACFAEDQLPAEWEKYTQINADYFKR